MKKILITGINGFAASHLARKLAQEPDTEVHGTIRIRSDLHRINDIKDKLKLHYVELTDAFSVAKVVNDIQPDEVYHLAAQSSVRTSWETPIETFRINVDGTINLLEACRKLSKTPRILNVSTSEVYGNTEGLVDEGGFPQPNTPYGVSKYAQELIGRMYCQAYKLPVVTTRSFNVTGPGRVDMFVDSSFAKQIAEIELGIKPPIITHGNLSTERDFTDVRDVVNGYVIALRDGDAGEVFIIASGNTHKIEDVLTTLISMSTMSNITHEVNPALFRPVDTKTMKGDAEKLISLGWDYYITFERSMKDLLDYWRNKLNK